MRGKLLIKAVVLPKGAIRLYFKKLKTSACIHCILHYRCTCPASFSWQPWWDTLPQAPLKCSPCLVLCCPQHWLSSHHPLRARPVCCFVHLSTLWQVPTAWAVVFVFFKVGGRAVRGAYLTEYEFSLECELCYSWCVHCYGSIVLSWC